MPDVDFIPPSDGHEVVVRGRRVPMLRAHLTNGGHVHVVFDGRLGLALDAQNYETVIAFVADVMENVMHPECGRSFNTMHEVGGVDGPASA